MATIIKVSGADFSAVAVGFVPPVASGLVGWWLLGGSQAASVRNLAPGGADAGVAGAPSYSAGYASFDGVAGAYFTTSIPEAESMTFVVAGRSADTFAGATTRPAFVSAYNNTLEPTGVALMAQAVGSGGAPACNMGLFVDYDSGTGAITATNLPAFDSFRAFAGVVEGGVGRTVYDLTGATSTTASSAASRSSTGIAARNMQIGAGYAGNRGISDIAFVAIYSRALSAGELTTIYEFVDPILAARGVTV